MEFEFDPIKSIANFIKHGINFDEAKLLWKDVDLLELSARKVDEPRTLSIGVINSKYWSAITTYRDTRVRIISVRRARPKEIALYLSKNPSN